MIIGDFDPFREDPKALGARLMEAVRGGNDFDVTYWLVRGAPPRCDDHQPLRTAIAMQHWTICDTLIKNGASVAGAGGAEMIEHMTASAAPPAGSSNA